MKTIIKHRAVPTNPHFSTSRTKAQLWLSFSRGPGEGSEWAKLQQGINPPTPTQEKAVCGESATQGRTEERGCSPPHTWSPAAHQRPGPRRTPGPCHSARGCGPPRRTRPQCSEHPALPLALQRDAAGVSTWERNTRQKWTAYISWKISLN